MTGASFSHVAGLAAFASYFLLTLVLLRIVRHRSPIAVLIVGAWLVWFATIMAAILSGLSMSFWPFTSSYWFGCMVLLFLYAGLYKSVSVRVLRDLHAARDHRRPFHVVFDQYLVNESYRGRVGILRGSGLVDLKEGRLRITPMGRIVAGAARMIQRLYQIDRSG